MVLYQGMYNVAHFEINNNLLLYEDVLVGDESDYKKLRKICFVSGSVYINKAVVEGSTIRGGAHVTIQDDSIFVNIVPENENDGIVIGITFYLDDSGNMYAYTEKRDGSPQGAIVESFNGRTGQVVPSDSDYNAGLISYNNEVSQLVAENVQDAVDELDQEIDSIQDEIEGLNAEHVAYDNITSTLAATNVQNAIDELDNDLLGKQNALTFDNTPTASSQNPVTSDGVYHAIENVESLIPNEADEIAYDNTVSQLTAVQVQAAIDELAAGKENKLTFDSAPTSGSSNPVTSDGIYQAIQSAGVGVVTSVNGQTGAVILEADDIGYNNTTSGLAATDVQAAIDEVKGNIPDDASEVSYDNTASGLTATDVQAAIDELATSTPSAGVTSFNTRTGAVTSATGDYDADQIDYDNTTSQLVATDAQAAIDEVKTLADSKITTPSSANQNDVLTFDGTGWIASAIPTPSTGVTSFNSRTGAVNPTSGDYSANQISYSNSSSGLSATDVQGAIDKLANGYRFKEYHDVSITLNDTIANKNKALADAVIAYLQSLGDNEVCVVTRYSDYAGNYVVVTGGNELYDKSTSSITIGAQYIGISTTLEVRTAVASTTLASCGEKRATITATPSLVVDDLSTASTAATHTIRLMKYVK